MYIKIACVLLLVSSGESARILGVFMTPSYSHQIVYQPIWRELSLRGHQVTVYTPNPINDPALTNLTEVDLSFSYKTFNNFTRNAVVFGSGSRSEELQSILEAMISVFDVQMSSPEMQKLVANENNDKYDLFLVEYMFPAMYPLKDVYKCPMVGIKSMPLTIDAVEALGMSKHPVLDPEWYLPFATNLSFKERVISTLINYIIKAKFALSEPEFGPAVKKFFGKDSRDAMEIGSEVSLILANSNLAIDNMRPTVPVYVPLSGMHLQPPKPLPQDLKQILDEAKQGAIYFSLGSNVKSSSLSEEKKETIVSALSELPYKVLWKFEKDGLKNLPSNVEIRKWLPQQDVLRHPNVKLFITQGGVQSFDEGINSAVPMLVIPFFADQHYNAHKIVNIGVGLSLNIHDFTKEELVEKIHKLILDPSYKKTVKKFSAIAYDEPLPPLEKAVWWIEYVLRHDGAPHLRYKATDMPFYIYYLLDVHLFLASIIFFVSYILIVIWRKLFSAAHTIWRKSLGAPSIYSKKLQ